MKTTHDLNFNATECLKTTADFGVSKVTNICTGAVSEVPWGSVEWATAIGITFMSAALILLILGIGLVFVREMIRGF